MGKKIGIITMHKVLNYGSALQAYALQKVLEDMGHDVEIIDYVYPNEYHKQFQAKPPIWRKILSSLINYIKGNSNSSRQILFDEFYSKHFNLSKTYNSPVELRNNPPVYDIYLTGSNSYLLSSEYSTYLSGRCVEIKMLPLSFKEFLYFHDFEVKETQNMFGGSRKQVFDKNVEKYELKEVFEAYTKFGGMPIISDIGFDQEKALIVLDGVYSTVVIRDILEREKRRGQQRITDPVLLKKIILLLTT